jgi:peptidyl-dipeptidase A
MISRYAAAAFVVSLTCLASRAAAAIVLLVIASAGCRRSEAPATPTGDANTVTQFLAEANDNLLKLGIAANEADWVQGNFITVDTQAISARANEAYTTAITDYAKHAAQFPADAGTPEERRQLTVLRNTLTMAGPADPKKTAELTTIAARLAAAYGSGKYCPPGQEGSEGCLDVEAVTKILAENRDPKRLRDVWEGWHTIAVPMKNDYVRFVELSNEGAKDVGFADTGAMWKSRYDMPSDAFAKEMDRLWDQLRPLYLSLHTHVRARLHDKYGDFVPLDGPIPAYLLGNIWAQEWNNIYDLVAPPGGRGVPLDSILKQRKVTPVEMAKYGERFFTSLGFDPLPKTFYERSLLTKPRDRDVVCHASAWDINYVDDLRIKMCIDPTAEDFTTIHHELGHNFYQRAYAPQPQILRDSANDGFHEAIGDTIALSVTPEYLVKVGLVDKAPDASGDLPLLMGRALEKLAFLPFGLVVDQWRWSVFSGQVKPDNYNKAWWDLRLKYQGVAPPTPRGEEFFDPGAKYHVPANTPYARYFLASVLQFQFHRSLAKAAGCTAPLHRCSIYDDKAAGERLKKALALGASRPWPDVLEVLTGQREMDATAIAEYFAPLKTWLDEQNQGRKTGW